MSELQDTINKIMSNPEAMRQVQSLGKQLGIGSGAPAPAPPPTESDGIAAALSKLAPLMNSSSQSDETAALLNALRPFLSPEKQLRLDSAKKLIHLIRMIPLLKDSGLFL